ncbi:Polygalacturonase At1g48100 [Linum grandiflorum]
MKGVNWRSFTFMVLVAFLVWSASFDTCIARRGRHWRHNRGFSASLTKKKVKSHGSSHHRNNHYKSPKKAPSPKAPNSPIPTPPSPIKPPKHVPVASPEPPSPSISRPHKDSSTFNVVEFGAKGDGKSDDTKAFQATWAAACKVANSIMLVPQEYQFLVGPISFSGPYCQQGITFQLDGTIVAPTNSYVWGKGLLQWLEFSKLAQITIQGKGTIDGSGSVWWQDNPFDVPEDGLVQQIVLLNNTLEKQPPRTVRSELSSKMPSIKPTALRFYGSVNVTVTGITIQNSPQCHLKFDNCIGVMVHHIRVSSPGDSPNTDGVHLQNSRDVLIHSSLLACGDDCISIQTGCSNVYIHDVNCGPGHGISIGSLGRDNARACVSNVTVKNVNMHNTMTGVRIKTWQGGSGSVYGIMFSNIQVSEVQFPIVIDQYYCDKTTCKNQSSAVSVSGINYEQIKGTYTVKPVHFACSDNLPCADISLTSIELKPLQEKYHMYNPFCWNTFGELNTPAVPPIDCLQIGKPTSNRPQTDHDSC